MLLFPAGLIWWLVSFQWLSLGRWDISVTVPDHVLVWWLAGWLLMQVQYT
jgi:hypothetical protein